MKAPIASPNACPSITTTSTACWSRGAAYYCNCPPEELEARRQAALARGEKPKYDGRCRELSLPPGPHTAVRFKAPDTGVTHWDDQIKGPIAFDNQELDDLVLQRADGIPTYNFAVVVDDITMGSPTSSGVKTTSPTPPGSSSSMRPWESPRPCSPTCP